MAEQWKKVDDFPNYQVDPEGNVRVEKGNEYNRRYRQLKHSNDEDGNLFVWVFSAGTGHIKKYVADLVLQAWVEPAPLGDGNQMWMPCHKDGNPANCRYDNLIWVDGNGETPTAQQRAYKPEPTRPEDRMYHTQILVCSKRTGQMFLCDSLKSAANTIGTSVQQLMTDLKVKAEDCEFLSLIKMRQAATRKPVTKERRDKVLAFDHVVQNRIVAATPYDLALLTGVDESAILGALHHRNYNMVAGYTFKWFKDPSAIPSFTKEQATVNRVEHFIPQSGEPKPKEDAAYKVVHKSTGLKSYFPNLEMLCNEQGWTTAVVEKMLKGRPNGLNIGAFRVSPC